MTLSTRQRIGFFEVTGTLGAGGMGSSYLCISVDAGRGAAVGRE